MPYWDLSDFNDFIVFNTKYDGIYEAYKKYTYEHPEIDGDLWYSSWEDCSLRRWLNSEMDFTPYEWDLIEETEIIDKTGLGANTSDKVFLLDSDDVEKYFPRNESRGTTCSVSDEEILRFLQDSLLMGSLSGDMAEKVLNDESFGWWVRGSVVGKFYLKPMSTNDVLASIAPSLKKSLGIRPAIWINIEP